MFPHVVTIINSWEENDLSKSYGLTILRGVLLDMSKGTNVAKSGLDNADSATLYIPFTVVAESVSGAAKRYVAPIDFYAADDKATLWTLDSGGKTSSTSTYFCKGELTEPMSIKELKAARDYVFDATTVDIRDFGGDMQHWQVGGR